MAEDDDWLFRPVDAGYCRYTDLKDGTLDLVDVAKMNEMIDVKAENEKRYRKANEE